VFQKDNSCEYVPSSWAIHSDKNLYLWPKKLAGNQIKKLRDNCTAPNATVDFEEWTATCKATVYDLCEAQKLADRVTYTSNLSSDDQENEGPCELTFSGTTANTTSINIRQKQVLVDKKINEEEKALEPSDQMLILKELKKN
ncbi:unnamed protein product, partial [Callosobruchus maculatus]